MLLMNHWLCPSYPPANDSHQCHMKAPILSHNISHLASTLQYQPPISKGPKGSIGPLTSSFTPFSRSGRVTHQILFVGEKPCHVKKLYIFVEKMKILSTKLDIQRGEKDLPMKNDKYEVCSWYPMSMSLITRWMLTRRFIKAGNEVVPPSPLDAHRCSFQGPCWLYSSTIAINICVAPHY